MNETLTKRYEELYKDMATSKDVEKMHAFGRAEGWAFRQLVATNPRLAQMWLDKLEAVAWKNYLSQAEAEEIVTRFVDQAGNRGPHWSFETFRRFVESVGGKMCDEPYYNAYALWVTAAMIYSDHARSIAEDMGADEISSIENDKMALSCYRKAVEKLKDVDRPRFVREYFEV